MAVREILQLGNPLLWQPSAAIQDPCSADVALAVQDLRETLGDFRNRFNFGRAIAAPQIGIHKRLLLVTLSTPEPLINPEIVVASPEMMELWDDCFSFPDLMVRVRRHQSIQVRYEDLEGRRHTIEASGDLSELLQHEIDHLDGILAVDRAVNPRGFALRSEVIKTSAS